MPRAAELGDYDPHRYKPGYVSEFRFLAHQSPDLETKIAELHKTMRLVDVYNRCFPFRSPFLMCFLFLVDYSDSMPTLCLLMRVVNNSVIFSFERMHLVT